MTQVSKEAYAARRELWYTWLRDPTHKQTAGKLRHRHEDQTFSHCCLGGACEVHHDVTGWGAWMDWDEEYFGLTREESRYAFSDDDKVLRSYTGLPEETREWLGMSTCDGSFDESQEALEWLRANVQRRDGSVLPLDWDILPSMLVSLNDGRWLTFPRIADFCATNPPGLWREGTY